MTPTLFASRNSLPPAGANFPKGGPSENCMTPTLVTSCTALPPEGTKGPLGAARRSLSC